MRLDALVPDSTVWEMVRCDRCEGRLFQKEKEDDRPESIEIRLKV